jgi:meiotic recombination protein SPO11
MMDMDLFSDLLTDHQPLTGSLLSNLPRRELTHGNDGIVDQRGEATNIRNPTAHEPGAVISKIEDMFESIGTSILHKEKEMVIRLKTREKPRTEESDSTDGGAKRRLGETTAIRFPSKNQREAWKFSKSEQIPQLISTYATIAALLRILELSHEALVTGTVMTKRSFFTVLLPFFIRNC